MDVMDIRRNLLLSIFGGEPAMIGEFSKYATTTFYSAEDSMILSVSLPFNETPKLVIVSCESGTKPYTTKGYIQYALMSTICGGGLYLNLANGTLSTGGLIPEQTVSSNGRYSLNDNGNFVFRQFSNNGKFAGGTSYKVEFYA